MVEMWARAQKPGPLKHIMKPPSNLINAYVSRIVQGSFRILPPFRYQLSSLLRRPSLIGDIRDFAPEEK